MGRRKYKSSATVALERGVGTQGSKKGGMIDQNTRVFDDHEREGLRGLDRMTEGRGDLSRAVRDNARILPRDTTAPLGHPAKDRKLLQPDAVRVPMSKRQRLERLHHEKRVLASLSNARFNAVEALVSNEDTWRKLNRGLADNLGDPQELSKADQTRIQRVDRAIQAYEEGNDRGHRVYANVKLNRGINSSNVQQYLTNYLPVESTVYFDQFTVGSHNMHEIEPESDNGRTVALEIHTRRGMFVGEPGDAQSNGHLFPRGLRLQVAGMNETTYTRPDGTRASRMCIQLLDMDNDEETS